MKTFYAQYTPKFAFTTAQLTEMGELQANANDVMSDEWRKSTNMEIAYFRASYVEAVEAICHIGFKWWKAETPNLEQAEMELVDILHFVLSDELRQVQGNAANMAEVVTQQGGNHILFENIGRWAGRPFAGELFSRRVDNPDCSVMEDISAMSFQDLAEQFIHYCIATGSCDIRLLYCLFESLGISPVRAYGLYVSKNALNKFRTANGQRDGSYSKIWDGREDNEHLHEFINSSLSADEPVDYHTVYSFLTERYSKATHLDKA